MSIRIGTFLRTDNSQNLVHLQFLLGGILNDIVLLKFFPKKIHCIHLRFGHALNVDVHRDADVDQRTFSSVALTVLAMPAGCLRRRRVLELRRPKKSPY